MNLKTTSTLMLSYDYKKRFIAEYWQLKIRYEKLQSMLNDWDNGLLNFVPTCSRTIYNKQIRAMKSYLDVLEKRAKIEDVNFDATDEIDYKHIVDMCARSARDFEECKRTVRYMFEREFNKELDYRSCFGREVLDYARKEWCKD